MAGMAAAGASAGAMFGPWGAAIGGIAGALGDTFGGGGGTAPMPMGPSSAANAVYGSGNLNADGWSVNFAGRQDVTADIRKDLSATGPTASTAAGGGVLPAMAQDATYGTPGASVPSWAMALAGGLLLWKLAA